jgi:hypothetical protein
MRSGFEGFRSIGRKGKAEFISPAVRRLKGRGRDEDFSSPTGSLEAVARLQFPQNVACGFTALRSSAGVSQHCKSLQLRVWEAQLWFQ